MWDKGVNIQGMFMCLTRKEIIWIKTNVRPQIYIIFITVQIWSKSVKKYYHLQKLLHWTYMYWKQSQLLNLHTTCILEHSYCSEVFFILYIV